MWTPYKPRRSAGSASETTGFSSDIEAEIWLRGQYDEDARGVFAWLTESNFSERRRPRNWAGKLRSNPSRKYSLVDAAELAASDPLDLSDA